MKNGFNAFGRSTYVHPGSYASSHKINIHNTCIQGHTWGQLHDTRNHVSYSLKGHPDPEL